MGVFIGAGFWLFIGFIAYQLHQANALNRKIIIGILILFWAIGTFAISYYYMMGDYLYRKGKVEQDCGLIIHPEKPLTARQQRKIQPIVSLYKAFMLIKNTILDTFMTIMATNYLLMD